MNTASERKLRPCPFCGSEAEVHREGTRNYSCVIGCTNCSCKLETNEIGYGDQWNQRFEDNPRATPTIEEEMGGECPRCGGIGETLSENPATVDGWWVCQRCKGDGKA
jgi:hypothetical protein